MIWIYPVYSADIKVAEAAATPLIHVSSPLRGSSDE
jgi:hypothetical protein